MHVVITPCDVALRLAHDEGSRYHAQKLATGDTTSRLPARCLHAGRHHCVYCAASTWFCCAALTGHIAALGVSCAGTCLLA